MSDGKKFIKTDANLSPEDRLAVVERNYSVILEKIQSYDQILVEFANINSDLQFNKESIDKLDAQFTATSLVLKEKLDVLYTRTNDTKKNQDLVISSLNDQRIIQQQTSENLKTINKALQHDIDVLHANAGINAKEITKSQQSLSVLEKSLLDLKKCISTQSQSLIGMEHDQEGLTYRVKTHYDELKAEINQLLTSFQELPQFNEWATKIYIKVCNEINEKQKAFYQELDKRSQQLQEKLASDPYTAESVKKILKNEMDALAMDGKNAYIKASNASQQIQLLEKKVENISLILKKYELNK